MVLLGVSAGASISDWFGPRALTELMSRLAEMFMVLDVGCMSWLNRCQAGGVPA
jgi:hypothetical protein